MGSAQESQSVVFAWGAGEDGQLGVPGAPPPEAECDEWHLALPTAVEALGGVRFPPRPGPGLVAPPLVAGSRQSLCVAADGQLLCWGWNAKQSLGMGLGGGGGAPAPSGLRLPRPVDALAGVRVAQACWGGWHGLCVTQAGEAYAWGGNENLQTAATAAPTPVVALPARILPALRVAQVAAGGMHSLALTSGGDVWAWGQPLTGWGGPESNAFGAQRAPHRVRTGGGGGSGGGGCVVQVAAGAFHNLALTASGGVLAWGHSDYGQLGLGGTTHVAEPTPVAGLQGEGVVQLAAGGWHSGAVTAAGDVWIWGRGEHGRLGLGGAGGDGWRDRHAPARLPLPGGARAAQLALGGTHSCVLTTDGQLLSFGRPSFGRLGRAAGAGSRDPGTPAPVELPPPPAGALRWRVDAVSAGGRHTLALARAVFA